MVDEKAHETICPECEAEMSCFICNSKRVLVLDVDGKFISTSAWARARKVVGEKKAFYVSTNPPAIRLMKKVGLNPRRNQKMEIPSFTKYFKEEKDIYVQNISGGVVSMLFGSGQEQEFYSLKQTNDPVVLTNDIPFEKIKKSTDFRKMATAHPPRIRILTEGEYNNYYEDKQTTTQKSADVLKREAEIARKKFQQRTEKVVEDAPAPIHNVVSDGKRLGEKKTVSPVDIIAEGEVVNPRILGACQKVSKQIPQTEWPSAETLLGELKTIADTNELSIEDFEHIRANVPYVVIKKWAQQKQAEFAIGADEIGDIPVEAPATT